MMGAPEAKQRHKNNKRGAPEDNDFAVKGLSSKTTGYRLRMTVENLELLKKIAKSEKIKISDVLEKALLIAYPKIFDGKF